jgi:pimeloyl-ACP methyl ester carboxylesterase
VTRRSAAATALAAVALLLAACSSSPAPRAASTTAATSTTTTTTVAPSTTTTVPAGTTGSGTIPPATITWSACDLRFECGTLAVPVSYGDPAEGVIHISVIELPSAEPDPIGDVVLNPGGPGASGIQYLEQSWTGFPLSLRDRFTLVSFDPRGIGASDPVVCEPPAGIRALVALPPAPVGTSQVDEVVAATRRFVAGCVASLPHDALANLATSVTARDMDRLRVALGQSKLTYFGYSYGTYLGAVYADLFPAHVRAMVLDGALDPADTAVQIEQQQGAAFEVDLHDFLDWCHTAGQCGAISTASDAYTAFEQLMGRFEAGRSESAALPAAFGGTQTVDYGVALLGVLTGLYGPDSWPDLGQALVEAESGNGTDLGYLADYYAGQQNDGSFANIVSANNAINCLDRPNPTGIATFESLAAEFEKTAPDFGGTEAWGSLTCAYWPIPPTGAPFTVHAPGLPPLLVVGSTHDPATPYIWAQALAAQLPGARLLTRTGDGHTAYIFSSCIRTWVDRYLTTLALPPAGTVCASDGNGLP